MNKNIKSTLKLTIDKIVHNLCSNMQEKEINSFGLYNGYFGQILFLLYYLKYNHNTGYDTLINEYIETGFNRFVEEENQASFSNGLAGELYLFEFLRKQNIINFGIGSIQNIFENYLVAQMREYIKYDYYDFMHGAVGIGIYFSRRESKSEYIYELIEYLYQSVQKDINNTVFKWESNLIYKKDIRGYNLSMSHGMSSIIIFLSYLIKNNIDNKKVQTMLKGAVNYILLNEVDFSQFGFCFPSFILKNSSKEIIKSRLGWCYGDLGVGMALWQAGKITMNTKWEEKGIDILLKNTQRKDLKSNLVSDAGICHGSAGIAMIFRRMYIETLHNEFKTASQYWLEKTLFFLQSPQYNTSVENGHIVDSSLLTGISGIGLVLLSCLNEDEQKWDNIFLLS